MFALKFSSLRFGRPSECTELSAGARVGFFLCGASFLCAVSRLLVRTARLPGLVADCASVTVVGRMRAPFVAADRSLFAFLLVQECILFGFGQKEFFSHAKLASSFSTNL